MTKLKDYITFLKRDSKAKMLIGLLLILLGLAMLKMGALGKHSLK